MDMHFSLAEREAVYRCIFERRDVRGEFLPTPVNDDVLARLLTAAHHAPSVGFMQPWDFVIVRSQGIKERLHARFLAAHHEAEAMFDDDRARIYRTLKLEGIREAPVGICVTCDRDRAGPVVIGRTHQPEMDLYSTVCAVQNLWLAARAEGLGVGWVSIIRPTDLRIVLRIPERIVPVAYLCVGYTSFFHERPELEKCGWAQRRPLDDLVAYDTWDNRGRQNFPCFGADPQSRLDWTPSPAK
jgi:5,6-dimethylbenzimidazole synthase